MLPWLVGVVPFGLLIGVTAAANGQSAGFGLVTGLGIYSGSAQLVALEMTAAGAAGATVVMSVLVINARLAFYALSLADHWRHESWRFRVLAAYLLVDPSYAEARRRYLHRSTGAHWFYLGAGVTLWIAWQASIITGALGGAFVSADTGLESVVPLFLLAELVGAVKDRGTATAAALGGIVALCSVRVPMHAGLLVAILAGIAAGAVADRRPG
jgi:4-azaleucine resistance transporter AzlC